MSGPLGFGAMILALGLICSIGIFFWAATPISFIGSSQVLSEDTPLMEDILDKMEPISQSNILPVIDQTENIVTINNLVMGAVILGFVSVCVYGCYLWFQSDGVIPDITNSQFSPEFLLMIQTHTTTILDAIKSGTISDQLHHIMTLIQDEKTNVETLMVIYDFVDEQLPIIYANTELRATYLEILECLSAIIL